MEYGIGHPCHRKWYRCPLWLQNVGSRNEKSQRSKSTVVAVALDKWAERPKTCRIRLICSFKLNSSSAKTSEICSRSGVSFVLKSEESSQHETQLNIEVFSRMVEVRCYDSGNKLLDGLLNK